ncbi:MAG: HAD family hydrolase [Bacteroidota bacterium]
MEKLSCVIFDLDGTLAQTNQLIFAAFNHVAQQYVSKTYSPEEITAMFGPPEEAAVESMVGQVHSREAMSSLLEYYGDHHGEFAWIHPGVEEMLEYLKSRNVRLGLFTGKGRSTTEITLVEFGLKRFFDVIVTGNDVVSHKPSAEGIRKILRAMNLKTECAVFVGDSINDIRAAREAGVLIASVVYDSFAKEKVLEMNPDLVFHSVDGLFSWVKNQLQTSYQ